MGGQEEQPPLGNVIVTDSNTPVTDDASSTTSTKNPLSARELEWANNPPELLKQHQERNGNIIRTRFPPEPNGYLHIGEFLL